jgi:hypothetical protein
VALDAQSTLVAESMGRLYDGPIFAEAHYDRIQFPIPRACEALDDPANVAVLRDLIEPALRQQERAIRLLDGIAEKLRARAVARGFESVSA